MFETKDATQMLARLDGQQLAKALRHLRHAVSDALDGRRSQEAGERFRLDDLVPVAEALAFFAQEVDWSRLRDLDAAEGGAR